MRIVNNTIATIKNKYKIMDCYEGTHTAIWEKQLLFEMRKKKGFRINIYYKLFCTFIKTF